MSVDLRLRYEVKGDRKTLSLADKDGVWQPLAMISNLTTRGSPTAEGAWKEMLGDAIETAAEAAEPS